MLLGFQRVSRLLSPPCRLWVPCHRSKLRVMSSEGRAAAPAQQDLPQDESELPHKQPSKIPRPFDWTMYNKRYIALHLAYLGQDYHGFAIQEPSRPTIESCLFEVLKKTRLIKDMQSCKYARCGRTDRGVSALGQVISLQVRSNLLEGDGVMVSEDSRTHLRHGNTNTELPYLVMLNRNLPDQIQALGWANVPHDFSARFSCRDRTYKYFFPRGNMDLEVMKEAAQSFVGYHDFRNFCKMDISGGVTNFQRNLLKFDIDTIDTSVSTPYQMQMCVATIVGHAFLMHQVRCMIGVLFLVGNGLEVPAVIGRMLDVEACPRKPQYGMAAPEPLVLYRCNYEGVEWQREEGAEQKVVAHFQQLWTQQAVKTTMLRCMVESLSSSLTPASPPTSHIAPLMAKDHKLGGNYRPILQRPTAPKTFAEKLECHVAKKRKIQEDRKEEEEEEEEEREEERGGD